jgi:hypothetical protein
MRGWRRQLELKPVGFCQQSQLQCIHFILGNFILGNFIVGNADSIVWVPGVAGATRAGHGW